MVELVLEHRREEAIELERLLAAFEVEDQPAEAPEVEAEGSAGEAEQ